MDKKKKSKLVVVFIDGDWLYRIVHELNIPINYLDFIQNIKHEFGQKVQVHFYGAINIKDKRQNIFYATLKKNGYIIHLEDLVKRGGVFISKGVEIALSIDAIQSAFLFEKFVLVSGDGDFIPLLRKIRNSGIEISIISLPFTMGYSMRKIIAGKFFNLESFIKNRKKRGIKILVKENKRNIERLFFDNMYIIKGEQNNAYIFLRNLICSAKKSIIIIDSYLDEQILMVIELLKSNTDVKILTSKKSSLLIKCHVEDLRNSGFNIQVYVTNNFHDRFLSVDNNWWHSGHSFKDLGERNSFFNKMITKKEIEKLRKSVEKEINIEK
jgi:uncharacterized LabA/DUF88 family protein